MYVEEEVLTRNLDGRTVNGGEIPLLPFIAGIQWQLYTQWQRYPFFQGPRFESWIKYGICRPDGQQVLDFKFINSYC